MESNAKSSYYAGLQYVALAIMFMPEPFTTPIGIALLAYARSAGRQGPIVARRLTNNFEDQYSYKLNMVRGTNINYQLSPRRHGQLPNAYPKIARLQDNPQFMKSLRERAKRQHTYAPVSKLEPAGLMRGPRLRDRAALVTPRNLTNPKIR